MSLRRKYSASCWLLILLIALFPFRVDAATFSVGATNTFASSASYDVGVKLDSTHVMSAYVNGGAGKAAIAVVDGITLTFGSEYQFCASSCDDLGIAMLDSTHVMIVYDVSGTGHALVATISGTAITFGADTTFASSLRANPAALAATAMDSTHVAITYVTGSSPFATKVIAATVSGDTLSFGSVTTLQSTSGQYSAIAAMDSTHFIAFYQQNDGTPHLIAASVSGNSMSFGSAITFSGYNSDPSVSKLDSTSAAITYRSTSSDNVYSFVVTLSGTSLSAGTSQAVNSVSSYYPSAAALDSTHLVLMFRNNSVDFNVHATYLTVAGGTVSGDTPVLALSTDLGNTNRIAIPLDSSSAVLLANNQAGVVTTDTTAPSAVTSFTANANNATVTFSWVNPVDVDFSSTTIRRSTTAYPTTATGDTLVASGVTDTSATDDSLSSGTYYYSIFARDLRGNYSAAANATALVSFTPSGGGGGVASFVLQLRQQNHLDEYGRPLALSGSSSSASSISSSAASSSSVSAQATHPAAMSSSASSAASFASSSSASSESPLQIRTCKRVMKWFAKESATIKRLNIRLLKWFGFTCA